MGRIQMKPWESIDWVLLSLRQGQIDNAIGMLQDIRRQLHERDAATDDEPGSPELYRRPQEERAKVARLECENEMLQTKFDLLKLVTKYPNMDDVDLAATLALTLAEASAILRELAEDGLIRPAPRVQENEI